MKLRNKRTGKLIDINLSVNMLDEDYITEYDSLEEFNEDWEDAPEEPRKYWFIDADFGICGDEHTGAPPKYKYEIGNYFETKEEAERTVEKLKAWKRLKDKGFELDAVVDSFFCMDIYMEGEPYEEIKEDLKIVFGGK